MIRSLIVVLLIAIAAAAAGAEPDRLAIRSGVWQNVLERNAFQFSDSNTGLLFSLAQFRGKCQVHMIYDPAKRWILTFKFVREGKAFLTIDGETQSAFRTDQNVLYFAHFPTSSSGCVVTAHDLATGEKLWETKLNAVGTPQHSAYSNEVTIELSSMTGTETEHEGIVSITGRESFGDYREILDQKTGKVLAHKVYRQGFGK